MDKERGQHEIGARAIRADRQTAQAQLVGPSLVSSHLPPTSVPMERTPQALCTSLRVLLLQPGAPRGNEAMQSHLALSLSPRATQQKVPRALLLISFSQQDKLQIWQQAMTVGKATAFPNPEWAELSPIPKRSCCRGSCAAPRQREEREQEVDRYPGLGLQKGKTRLDSEHHSPFPSTIPTVSATTAQKAVTVQGWGILAALQHPWCSLPQAGVGSAASPHCCSQQLSAPTLGDSTPRCPREAAFSPIAVRRSIPGCPSLILVCSCSPDICNTAGRSAHTALPEDDHAGGVG